ncbi:hypothetical protein BJ684DRAFT_17706 [Piptocephalis cylindrospora]|uniref:Uncharacterized protein n=1 Tax=Piptocephalis cylindrospora TaxID=1907219 RepID=A0A4P9XZ96_9FUNG|nr:hypothetical protein BJ684DRAFT_17706 [Piptocephalis cylindrospora]|eukprot:RKP11727.1 hypothetical protein BJ684DRAFT_17706 [Piptocephalis cylindrospora]
MQRTLSVLSLLLIMALAVSTEAGINDEKAKAAEELFGSLDFPTFTLHGPAKVNQVDSYGSSPGPQKRNVRETLIEDFYLDKIDRFYYMPSSDLFNKDKNEGILSNADPQFGDIKANSPLVAGYDNVTDSQDPVVFQFNHIAIKTNIPHLPGKALYAFQLQMPDGKCLSSTALSRRFMAVNSNPSKHECGYAWPDQNGNKEMTISSTLEASDKVDYLGTLWLATQDIEGHVHICNVRDLIKGYWSCLNAYGEVAKCSDDVGMRWTRKS